MVVEWLGYTISPIRKAMIEYLAIARLMLMVASHIALQFHCFKFQRTLPMVASEASDRTLNISSLLEASAVALEDIADLLEGGQTGPPAMVPNMPQSNPIQALLSSVLMSRMGMDDATWPAVEPSQDDSPSLPEVDEDRSKLI